MHRSSNYSYDQQSCLKFTVDVMSMHLRIRLIVSWFEALSHRKGGDGLHINKIDVLVVPFTIGVTKKQFLVRLIIRLFSLKRSTAKVFSVPFRALSQQQVTRIL